MSRAFYLSVVVAISFVLFSACANDTNSKKENTATSNKEVVQSEQQAVEGDIVGIWVTGKKGRFMEFKGDGTYAIGRKEKDPIEGKTYKFDKAKSSVTIETNKGSKTFLIRFEKNKNKEIAFFKVEGKEKEVRYTKEAQRPVNE